MSENELAHQLLKGLKQLDDNLKIYTDMYIQRGVHLTDTVVKAGIDNLKLQYANASLSGLREVTHE